MELNNRYLKKRETQRVDLSEDDEIEQMLHFRSLTSGLGFQKKEKVLDSPESSLPKASQFKRERSPVSPNYQKEFLQEDLKAFYQSKEVVREEIQAPTQSFAQEKVLLKNASEIKRLFAFFLDNVLLFVMTLGTLFLIDALMNSLFSKNIITWNAQTLILGCFFYTFYFLTYFSLSERLDASTTGKRLLGLELVSEKTELNFFQTFSRSLMTLLSFPLIGLPMILGIDTFVTNTRVIQK
ncbi:MAG: RDD family protein [Halobacteriovoraceae bacterium]|nr:RDD family protein [Halobacteriovoraceae bacterium]